MSKLPIERVPSGHHSLEVEVDVEMVGDGGVMMMMRGKFGVVGKRGEMAGVGFGVMGSGSLLMVKEVNLIIQVRPVISTGQSVHENVRLV